MLFPMSVIIMGGNCLLRITFSQSFRAYTTGSVHLRTQQVMKEPGTSR